MKVNKSAILRFSATYNLGSISTEKLMDAIEEYEDDGNGNIFTDFAIDNIDINHYVGYIAGKNFNDSARNMMYDIIDKRDLHINHFILYPIDILNSSDINDNKNKMIFLDFCTTFPHYKTKLCAFFSEHDII